MTTNPRATFELLADYCDAMERAVASHDHDAMCHAWDAANIITVRGAMSDYEDAIACAFDRFDLFMRHCEYMDENRDAWTYEQWRVCQHERERLAGATCAQQELIRHIFGASEDTVHDDLVLWRRYIDLYHEVAGLRIRRMA